MPGLRTSILALSGSSKCLVTSCFCSCTTPASRSQYAQHPPKVIHWSHGPSVSERCTENTVMQVGFKLADFATAL